MPQHFRATVGGENAITTSLRDCWLNMPETSSIVKLLPHDNMSGDILSNIFKSSLILKDYKTSIYTTVIIDLSQSDIMMWIL